MSAGRIWSIVIVALLHAILGYAFVSGLAMRMVEEVKEDLKVVDVTEEPPPPEEEPPPPPPDDVPDTPPPVTAPPVNVRLQTPNPMVVPPSPPAPVPFSTTPPTPAPPAPPTPPSPPPAPPPPAPPPPAPSQARPAQHRSGSISDDDYPSSALRAEAAGTTTARFTIGTDGRVTSCSVTGSSGNSALDSTTCSLIQRRFRYRPAQDAAGNPIPETKTQRIVWRLPAD